MKRFNYKARDRKTGKSVKGSIQADNERMAGKILVEQGYTPDSIIEENEGGWFLKSKKKIRIKDKILFTRQFATLIGAGLPLSDSLRTVADQTENKRMKGVVEGVLAAVESGKSLNEAFSKYPEVFDHVYLSLIAAGEMSGTLDDALKRLANQQEKDAEMMSKIRGAMTYPAIVLAVILGVMLFMVLAVMPQVESLYRDMKQELPPLTVAMLAFADFLMNFWWLMLIVLVVGIWFLISFSKSKTGIKTGAMIKLNVPLFKGLFRRLYMARFSRTAQILLNTGVAMLDTLEISASAMNNVVVNEQMKIVMEKVKSGKALSESLRDRDYVLPLVPQMASIGEQSGKMGEMLGKVAQVYEDEVDEQIRTISTMIEPILMVTMAVMAGGMIGAILFPIYSLIDKI